VKRATLILYFAAGLGAAAAQGFSGGIFPYQSSSGQFVVFASAPAGLPLSLRGLASNTNFISLQPTLLAVSCERIHQKLWDQLGVAGPWEGKIQLNLYQARSADEPVAIVAERSSGGWTYRVGLPDVLPRDRFLGAIVEVVLSELANRRAGARAAEIPAWLLEGLCGEVRAGSEAELFLPPPTMNVRGLSISPQIISAQWSNPAEQARDEFRSRPPLTFEQLSWPDGLGTAADRTFFSRSSLLFVDALLRLNGGPASLRNMLEKLPRYYNWQIPFLQAFHSTFQTPLEVEKWWALQVVYFTGRGLFDRWTPLESLAKLDETLRLQSEFRSDKQDLPLHTNVSLQSVIREWDLRPQAVTLQRKVTELELMRLRVDPAMTGLVDDYQDALRTYLQRRGLVAPLTSRRLGAAIPDRTAQETVARLNALDLRRDGLRSTLGPR
jgi:hypothetical protein